MSTPTYTGHVVIGTDGEIGPITDVISDPQSMAPTFVAVKVGFFAGERLVPVRVLQQEGDHFQIPFDSQMVKDTPQPADRAAPLADELQHVCRHYGLASAVS